MRNQRRAGRRLASPTALTNIDKRPLMLGPPVQARTNAKVVWSAGWVRAGQARHVRRLRYVAALARALLQAQRALMMQGPSR